MISVSSSALATSSRRTSAIGESGALADRPS